VFFAVYLDARAGDKTLFASSQGHLNVAMGLANTCILLVSSWFVFQAVSAFRNGDPARAHRMIGFGAGCGALFLVGKAVEYGEKLQAGVTPVSDSFYMHYFVLTGVHAFHVMVGLCVLSSLRRLLGDPCRRPKTMTVEAAASYWHMVDVLWIVLFPLLYLV
jgi:nitric oxide reductase NorE protein